MQFNLKVNISRHAILQVAIRLCKINLNPEFSLPKFVIIYCLKI